MTGNGPNTRILLHTCTSYPLTDKSSVAIVGRVTSFVMFSRPLIESSLSRSSSLLLHSSWAAKNCELSYVRLETRTTTGFLSDEPAGAFPSSPDVSQMWIIINHIRRIPLVPTGSRR